MMNTFKKQIASIHTENDLKDAHIAISQLAAPTKSAGNSSWRLRSLLKAKRVEKGFTWGKGI